MKIIAIIFLSNFCINFIIILVHPFARTSWSSDIFQTQLFRIVIMVLAVLPCFFTWSVLNSYLRSFEQEEKEKEYKKEIRKKSLERNRTEGRRR
jgi:Na+/melibiose symporter-like transporter